MGWYHNLSDWLSQADDIDRAEGAVAYHRYHQNFEAWSKYYDLPFDRVVAAFVALSPNSDYRGNLRSLASVIQALQAGSPISTTTVSTYKHCRDRAAQYLTGEVRFLDQAKGPKIRAFYKNILNPEDPYPVTIDGHMVAAAYNQPLTMKQAVLSKRRYNELQGEVHRLAGATGRVPNQVQATIWFARKRVLRIAYNAQLDLFAPKEDVWGVRVPPEEVVPYPPSLA